MLMKPYDVDEAMDVIENGGEYGTSYTNECFREHDIQEAHDTLEREGYSQDCYGNWSKD